jgi:hypothetical protein
MRVHVRGCARARVRSCLGVRVRARALVFLSFSRAVALGCAGGHPTMTMKLPKKATTVPSKRFWNSGLRALEIVGKEKRGRQKRGRTQAVAVKRGSGADRGQGMVKSVTQTVVSS